MNCSAYASRSHSLFLLAVVLAFSAGFVWTIARIHDLPLFWSLPVGVMLAIALVAVVHGLVSRNARLRVDEAGVHYYPWIFPVIEWADVVAAERMPKVVRSPGEVHSSLREDWRPIRLFVRNPEKYLNRVPALLRPGLRLGAPPGCVRLEIDCAGLEPGSGMIYDCIQSHLAQRVCPVNPAGS